MLLSFELVSELFLHCNGGHYYRAALQWCPGSGYRHELWGEITAYAKSARDASYEGLLEAGAGEAHVMHALFVPSDVGADSWVCAGTAPDELVSLVVARDRWLLERFPNGLLAEALIPRPELTRAYFRRETSDLWILVSHSTFKLPLSAPAQQTLEALLIGKSCAGVEVKLISRDAEYPPLAMGDEYVDFVEDDHPLIPRGHLLLKQPPQPKSRVQ